MPTIPIDDMVIRRYSETTIGHLFCHNVTIPVIVTTAKDGSKTVQLNDDPQVTLGEWLEAISQQVTQGAS